MSQASFRFRSFLFGITVASLTWGASIYLYLSLNSSSTTTRTSLANSISEHDKSRLVSQNKNYIPLRDLSNRSGFMKQVKKEINESVKSNGEWKVKLKQLVDDGTMYKNSQSVLRQLKSKVRVINAHGPYKEPSNRIDELQDPDSNLGLIKTIQEKKEREEGFKKHAFNTLISSRLSYHRNIPDTRHDR